MNKRRVTSGGSAVETHGRASFPMLLTKTHGRASLRAMPAGKARGGMFLLVGLVLLFGACERDIEGGFGDGGKVEVFFSTDITNYQAGADVTRSGGVGEPESRRVFIDDSTYLQATLVPDEEGELRGPASFTDGQKLCFAAFKADGLGQVGSTAVYTYSTSTGKWSSSAPLGVVPDNSTTYRFVAYSYFGSTGTPALSSINPSNDLVWGKSADMKIVNETETARTVTINMLHKFARVKVQVKSAAAITSLSGVQVDGGQLAGLTPFDGGIGWSGSVTQDMGLSGSYSATEVNSAYRTVKPVASPVKVKVGSVRVSGSSTFTNKEVEFNSALAEAASYTLLLELKKGVLFAYSNIYWDGGKMTFDTTDKGHIRYQGLYFKWGSLVGISPVGAWVNSSTPVYKAGETTSSTYSTWDAIPYDNTTSGIMTYGYNVSTLKGDICKYIDAGYRLPHVGEFSANSGAFEWGTPWVRVNGADFNIITVPTDKTNGTYNINPAARNTTNGGATFPASGHRAYNDGSLAAVGTYGYYRADSGSPAASQYSNDRASAFLFSASLLYADSDLSTSGTSIRCIKN